MDKLKMHSPDLTRANIAKIAELFPSCVTETIGENGGVKLAIDFDQLRQELSDHVVDGPRERYQLNWPGKREALLAANAQIAKTLRPCVQESVDFNSTQNIFIEGDNLDALKLMQECYLGKVKMIYIDPPYNTGNDFLYNDVFHQSSKDYLIDSEQVNSDGERLVTNSTSNGRFHSDWLTMIYPRLKLARNLLQDDGVIFVSIDDNELVNLLKLCNEVFGEENYIGIFSVENNPKGRKNSRFISVSNDYCVVFARNRDRTCFVESIPKSVDDMAEDDDGNFVHKSGKRVLVGENSFNKPVSNFESDKHYSAYYNRLERRLLFRREKEVGEKDAELTANGYVRYASIRDNAFIENTYTETKLAELFSKGSLEFTDTKIFEKNFSSLIRIKSMLVNREYAAIVNGNKSQFRLDVKTTSAGTMLKELFKSKDLIFPAPKNIGLIKLFATLFEEKTFLVLDFFAGSSTTAHALMALNAEDGGNRRFIMVQCPEICASDSEAAKAGFNTISELSKERIRLAGTLLSQGATHSSWRKDVGFRLLRVDSTNLKDVFYQPDELKRDQLFSHVDNIKEDRSPEDLLFQVLIDWGVDLSLPIEQESIEGKTIFFVDQNALAACFDTGITEELVKKLATRKPLRVVFRDSGFSDDSVKINVEQIFKLMSPGTEVKSI